ncbi:hypothetical protein COY13_01915 [Candidatus Roizmanbacteria bacterium CG_4_10_14_0_2_um_filter_36_35]|uniref:Transglutaminase-like domain-containing protein n=4 Tax=Candidatus Roizmaniibacteriota TaxID=1752723 RepID=A0A2M7BWN5_9BACT|nr:MAG: hypothetical protein COV86_02445 [Candidatus Roizmanbacteria bacterium CG11_big_fil_rev_8_21_14_0_20_35_14]PIV10961.1 MAG: hypothetical protein COS50_02645 [Candidatus Roizmanbacteria bacterium CG03_land_8_20_14_0_80_35_26]PIZ68086.1 MAG: hypothetical protein COY13_01915 [Candidatus Roizmanbacteria bacterium CG_4_10_14_0_2_um_filter_36_35]PJC32616.1 MAG: hypothetical protein CO049_02480 [Candidatus Roizmanbacteria bacterium CG_4_9_14_0_2_um_filter_36_12]PJC80633.1 MAG: hypothetical prot
MNQDTLNHYLQFSVFTNPGNYKKYLKTKLPDDIKQIGLLVRKQIIHRVTLKNGNIGSNSDLRYGDMTKVPWYRQPEDDILTTASSMLAELFRRDERGFALDRKEKDRLILTCRFVSILMASILKSKGIPCRVRSGFTPYFNVEEFGNKSVDHWINQYWDREQNRWITIDVDGSLESYLKFNPYNMPDGVFDFAADAWLNIRQNKVEGKHFWNAGGYDGLIVTAWELFYDFHCLMNNEIVYLHGPAMVKLNNFDKLTKKELSLIDNLANLMTNPDKNFYRLRKIWETNKEFRLLKGALL